VAELASRIYVHSQLRTVFCIICGKEYDEQYVAAGLFEGDRLIGDICCRCIAVSPTESADRLRARGGQVLNVATQAHAHEVVGNNHNTDAQQTDARPKKSPDQLEMPATNVPHIAPGSDPAMLAHLVVALPGWNVTIAELIEAERTILRQRFMGLREDDLKKLVDERYDEYFEEAPEDDPNR
jgi:hypothetical protein